MVQVAIMGYGTIGSGVAEILAKNAEQIKNVVRMWLLSMFWIFGTFREARWKTRSYMIFP